MSLGDPGSLKPHRGPRGNNEGDIFLAFCAARPVPMPPLGVAIRAVLTVNCERIDPINLVAVDAPEEVAINFDAIDAGD